jgi:rfaE bifunctional protein nucleotidyltransferase chain/domain
MNSVLRDDRVLSLDDLVPRIADHRQLGHKIVFTNGCFDLLHAGHLHCLTAAKAEGDILVVALNSDAGVRRLKGASRPIVNQRDRAAMLAALTCVDYVTIFDDDTPERLIAELHPDVLVKGAEARPAGIPGEQFVVSHGGRVVCAPLLPGISTTAFVERLRSDCPPSCEPGQIHMIPKNSEKFSAAGA